MSPYMSAKHMFVYGSIISMLKLVSEGLRFAQI